MARDGGQRVGSSRNGRAPAVGDRRTRRAGTITASTLCANCTTGLAGIGARACRLDIVGGDLSRAPALTIAITAVGEVRPSNVKTRAGGRPSAVLAVTGALGAARAGLDCASGRVALSGDAERDALRAFRRPEARCAEGRFLGASANVQAMMDVSDGLSTDLDRLCAASGCGSNSGRRSGRAGRARSGRGARRGSRAIRAGGRRRFRTARRRCAACIRASRAPFSARFKRPLHRVGVLRAESGIEFRGEPLARTGWDHFSK